MSGIIAITTLVQASQSRQREIEKASRWGASIIEPNPVRPGPVMSWPDSKLMAILMVYRTEHARECIARWSDVRASQEDFLTLRKEALIFKRELARFHELLPLGRSFALAATGHVARKLNLHHITYMLPNARHSSVRCTCGWSASFDERYGRTERKIERAIGAHLEATRA